MSNISKDIFCFVPAKYGSQRLPKKNILPLLGKEMIGYGLEAIISSEVFNTKPIVSTESVEVKSIAEKHGAEVPYLRREELARDPYGVVDVLLDFFENFPEFKEFENVMIVLPCAPLISSQDILQSYSAFKKGKGNCLMSVTTTDHSALRSCFIQNDKLKPIFPEFIKKKSQELETTYRINGAVCILNIQYFLEKKSYLNFPIDVYVMPQERSVDVDSAFDFKMAEILLKEQESNT